MPKDLSLLGLYAHPDDEQLISGTLAQCASEGIRTGLLCATRGEAGEIHESVEANRENIGKVREAELRAAAVVLGVKHLYFLDYRDSGWIGSPDNDRPDSFNKCGSEEALGHMVRVIREFRPTILTTFDPTGGYGHLDHLMIQKLSLEAFDAAADPARFPEAGEPWQAARLYYSMFTQSVMRRLMLHLQEVNPGDNFLTVDAPTNGLEDEALTNEIDVTRWLELKDRSLRCHRTQKGDYDRWQQTPRDLILELRATEYFMLARGVPLPDDPAARYDLFAGLRD
jgi:N-acetyl-1-D-myo-inositol-2-amino-2-deoxy-alpha-D-glucopyranoside deacetylase